MKTDLANDPNLPKSRLIFTMCKKQPFWSRWVSMETTKFRIHNFIKSRIILHLSAMNWPLPAHVSHYTEFLVFVTTLMCHTMHCTTSTLRTQQQYFWSDGFTWLPRFSFWLHDPNCGQISLAHYCLHSFMSIAFTVMMKMMTTWIVTLPERFCPSLWRQSPMFW